MMNLLFSVEFLCGPILPGLNQTLVSALKCDEYRTLRFIATSCVCPLEVCVTYHEVTLTPFSLCGPSCVEFGCGVPQHPSSSRIHLFFTPGASKRDRSEYKVTSGRIDNTWS